MRISVLVLLLMAGAAPMARAQARDTPPPSIQNARRERELREVVASGAATRETYLELTNVAIALNRIDEAVAALHGAAELPPTTAEAQHMFATIAWEQALRHVTDPAGRLLLIREGLALEDRALASKPDYVEALTYKNLLLRQQAALSSDPAQQADLLRAADAARDRAIALQNEQRRTAPTEKAAPASFAGFGEPFDQSVARLAPVRVGGTVRQPIKTRDVRPAYPAEAQAARVQGVVIIEALVDSSGSVANARILRSIPPLDDAALAAVSLWQFTPTLVNGTPAAVLITVTVNFTVQGQ